MSQRDKDAAVGRFVRELFSELRDEYAYCGLEFRVVAAWPEGEGGLTCTDSAAICESEILMNEDRLPELARVKAENLRLSLATYRENAAP